MIEEVRLAQELAVNIRSLVANANKISEFIGIEPDNHSKLLMVARLLEVLYPFEPVDEATKALMRAEFLPQLQELSGAALVEMYCRDWTEAKWRWEYDERNK